MRSLRIAACACALGLITASCGGARPATSVPHIAAAALPGATPAPVVQPPAPEPAPPPSSSAAAAPPPTPDLGLRIPILMYHVIARPAADAPLKGLYVDPTLFAAQMRALRAAGYQAVTMAQAYAFWEGRATPPAHPVVLSFDDGYVSVYENALPVLQSMSWPGVLCQQVQRIDFPGGFTAAQIRTMLAAGWELADHAITQPEVDLTTSSASVIHFEVFDSRSALQARFDVPVRFFCYPVGHYNPAAEAAVRAAGFVAALGTVFGPADPAVEGMYRLERLRVWAGETPGQVVASVNAAAAQAPPTPPASYPEPAPPPKPAAPPAPRAKSASVSVSTPAPRARSSAASASTPGPTAKVGTGATKAAIPGHPPAVTPTEPAPRVAVPAGGGAPPG